MKVKDLIEALKKEDPESMVVVSGYEGGVNEVGEIRRMKIKLNQNTSWYYGEHNEDQDGEAQAIYICKAKKQP